MSERTERTKPMEEAEEPERTRERVRRALGAREARRIPEAECPVRAAVALVLGPGGAPPDRPTLPPPDRPPEGPGGSAGGPAGGARGETARVRVLFVQRAERADDPWSGHVALPGGRRSPGDADATATALRETREETSLHLRREDVLGRLDDVRPLSRRLPPIAVTPLVAWYEGSAPVRGNREIRDHIWIPLDALDDPRRRSVLRMERNRRAVVFPSIEYGTYTIWGLTFGIVSRFLDRLRAP